jgi:hypothetical protein
METKGREQEDEESDKSEDDKDSVRNDNEVRVEVFCRNNPIKLKLLTSQNSKNAERDCRSNIEVIKRKNFEDICE